MLSYNSTLKKASKAVLNKNSILAMLFLLIPALIYAIVSIIILYGYYEEINLLIDAAMKAEVMDETVIKNLFDGIIACFQNNLVSIIIDLAISLVALIITEAISFVLYYSIYCSVNKIKYDSKHAFSTIGGGIAVYFAVKVRVLLWSLLLIVPGIIKCYEYALAVPIKLENSREKVSVCLKKSKELMKGRKERLFIQSIITFLFCQLLSMALSLITSFLIIPFVQDVLVVCANFLVTILVNAYFNAAAIIFYGEIEFDNKILEENPKLKEDGVTYVIRPDPDEKPVIVIRTFGAPPDFGEKNPQPQQQKPRSPFEEDEQNNPFEEDKK